MPMKAVCNKKKESKKRDRLKKKKEETGEGTPSAATAFWPPEAKKLLGVAK